jgi:Bifunctional DNA primase/polymerase, N-terminal/Primase C terminal 2 (PriCT-2)
VKHKKLQLTKWQDVKAAVLGTRPFGVGFERYDPARFDLIDLHRWNAVKRLSSGTRKNIGKAPVDSAWTTMVVDSLQTMTRCLSTGRNMGVRLKVTQLVIDVDPRNGGINSFGILCADIGLNSDPWPRVITGSGGFHCYLLLPGNFTVQETLADYPGIEFKSVGRQVVAAGSRHPNGKFYRWSKGHPDIRKGVPLAPRRLRDVIQYVPRNNSGGSGGEYTIEQLANALARLDVTAFRDEHDWRILMFACHDATDGEGEREFVEWSASDPQFAEMADDVTKRWRSLDSGKSRAITFRTLNKILGDHDASEVIPSHLGDDFNSDDDVELVGDANEFEAIGDGDELESIGE